MVVFNACEIDFRQRLQDFLCGRSLQRKQCGGVRLIGKMDIFKVPGLLFYPGIVFVNVGRVDDQHVMHVRQVINEQVIDGIAIGHTELRIKGLANGETRDIVRDEILQERQGARSFNLEFTHVADVEEASAGAYRFVLLQNTAVLYRHFPATKLYEPCA